MPEPKVVRAVVYEGVDTGDNADRHWPARGFYYANGRQIPIHWEPRCTVCTSGRWRWRIEEQLIAGRTYANIWRALPEDLQGHGKGKFSREGIRRHAHRHFPDELRADRIALDVHTAALGAALHNQEETVIDAVMIGNSIMRRMWRKIQTGEVDISVQDALGWGKMLVAAGQFRGSTAENQGLGQLIRIMHATMEAVCTPEQMEDFSRRINANPAYHAITGQHDSLMLEQGDDYDEQELEHVRSFNGND